MDLNVKYKTIKLLLKNRRKSLQFSARQRVLILDTRNTAMRKTDKVDFSKI